MVEIKTQLQHDLNTSPQQTVLVHTDSAKQLHEMVANQQQAEDCSKKFQVGLKPFKKYIN